MPTVSEYIFYSIFNYIPYLALAFYPLRYFKRYSKRINLLIILVSQALQTILLLLGQLVIIEYAGVLSMLASLVSLSVYFIAFKTYWGRLLFNMLMLTNLGNCVIICGKFLESQLFSSAVYQRYHWTFTVCMIIVEVMLLCPFFFVIKHISDKRLKDEIVNTVWNYVWIIPASLCIIWFYMFYYTSGQSSLEMSLKLSTVIFSLLIVITQFIIYGYVASLNVSFSKIMELEESSYHISIQSLQYKNMQEQIKETRVLRHDMRHHITVMQSYLETKQYDELNTYLKDYASSMSEFSTLHFTENSVLNLVLCHSADRCKQVDIDYTVKCAIPEELPFSNKEIAVLFGNLLENAFDACDVIPKSQPRFIQFSGRHVQNQLFFSIENTFQNDIMKTQSGQFVSTKHAGNGIGTASAKNIVTKNSGSIRFETVNNTFRVSIILPLSEAK